MLISIRMVKDLAAKLMHALSAITPNQITLARVAALPILALLLLPAGEGWAFTALAFYALLAGSDWLDGWLARRTGLYSTFGAMLDPIADKLLVTLVVLLLCVDGRISDANLIPALAILLREVFISGLRDYLASQNIALPVSRLAKIKTALQLLSLGFLIVSPYALLGLELFWPATLLFWLAAALTLYTAYDYAQALHRLQHVSDGPAKEKQIP